MTDFVPQIVAFCCSNCASAAARVSDSLQLQLPPNVRIVQLPCTGRLDALHLMKTLESGADGVYVAGCQDDSCKYKAGILRAAAKVKQVQDILEAVGIERERVSLYRLMAGKGHQFVDIAHEVANKIKQLGPSPMRD